MHMTTFEFSCVVDQAQWSKRRYTYHLVVPHLGWIGEQTYLGASGDGLEKSWRLEQEARELHLIASCEPHVKSTARVPLPQDAVLEELCVAPSKGLWAVTCPATPRDSFRELMHKLLESTKRDDLPTMASICESIWRLDNPTDLDLPLPPELCCRVQRMGRRRGWDEGAIGLAMFYASSKEAVAQLAREDALVQDDIVRGIEYGMNRSSCHPNHVKVDGVWVFAPLLEVFGIDPGALKVVIKEWPPYVVH